MAERTALGTFGGAISGFRDFAAAVKGGVPVVRAGSVVESDQALAGNVIMPHGIIAGLVGAVADHLSAWAELADSPGNSEVMLHLQADYTLFRPVLEGLVEVIWILDGADSSARVKRALQIAKIEYRHGLKLVSRLNKAGTPDERTADGIAALGRLIRDTANALGMDAEDFVQAPLVEPSSITTKIAQRVPGPSLQTYRYWAIASAHAHGQLITTLRYAIETPLQAPHPGGALFEPDEYLLAELIEFVVVLLQIVVEMLRDQGYDLRR